MLGNRSAPVKRPFSRIPKLDKIRQRLSPPLILLLVALSVFPFIYGTADRGYLYRAADGLPFSPFTAKDLAIAENLSPSHAFRLFSRRAPASDGSADYIMYSRFPIFAHALIKLAILPFGNDMSAKILAGRFLSLFMFCAAAALFFLALSRLVPSPWIAFSAVLLAFASFYPLHFADVPLTQGAMDLFAVALAFHGMTLFVRDGRFLQFLAKTLAALLIGWHVYALVMPFVAFGLAREGLAALRSRDFSPLLRSRRLALGAAAVLFGSTLLALNIASEYAAYEGDVPVARLPSVVSISQRFGADPDFNATRAIKLRWDRVIRVQFNRALEGFVPFALPRYPDDSVFERFYSYPNSGAVLGAILSAAALAAAAAARRHKTLWATLAIFPLCWGFGLRHHNFGHPFEGIFYIGVSLALISLGLTAARAALVRTARRVGAPFAADRVLAVVAVIAFAVFCASALRMARTLDEYAFAEGKRQLADFQSIRDIVGEGKTVFVDESSSNPTLKNTFGNRYAINFYLAGSVIGFADRPEVPVGNLLFDERFPPGFLDPNGYPIFDIRLADYDYTVATREIPGADTLTPDNRIAFLYDSPPMELFAGEYRAIVSNEPVASSVFDIYLSPLEDSVSYAKQPCSRADAETRFFLYAFPLHQSDLPETTRASGFEALQFDLLDYGYNGVVFDGKCYVTVPLPSYPISRIQTGQFISGGSRIWSERFATPSELERMRRYQPRGEPAARSTFDIYLEDGALAYVKSPCDARDARGRFFLSVHPKDVQDLPEDRREIGHDSLNFDFAEFGTTRESGCVMRRPLPAYPIERIETGQWIPGEPGHLWSAEFAVGD